MSSDRSGPRTSASSDGGSGAGPSTNGGSVDPAKTSTPSTIRSISNTDDIDMSSNQTLTTAQEDRNRIRHELATERHERATETWARVSSNRITINNQISELIVGTCGEWADSCLTEYSAFQRLASEPNLKSRDPRGCMDPTIQDEATAKFARYLIRDDASYFSRHPTRFTATSQAQTPISKFTQMAAKDCLNRQNQYTWVVRDSLTDAQTAIVTQEMCMKALSERIAKPMSTYESYKPATESKATSTGTANQSSRLPLSLVDPQKRTERAESRASRSGSDQSSNPESRSRSVSANSDSETSPSSEPSLAPTNDFSESKPPSKDRAPSRSTRSTAFTVGTSLCAAAVVTAGGAYLAYNKWWKD